MVLDDWSSPRASYSSPRTSTKARLLPLSLNDDHYQPKLDAPPVMLPDLPSKRLGGGRNLPLPHALQVGALLAGSHRSASAALLTDVPVLRSTSSLPVLRTRSLPLPALRPPEWVLRLPASSLGRYASRAQTSAAADMGASEAPSLVPEGPAMKAAERLLEEASRLLPYRAAPAEDAQVLQALANERRQLKRRMARRIIRELIRPAATLAAGGEAAATGGAAAEAAETAAASAPPSGSASASSAPVSSSAAAASATAASGGGFLFEAPGMAVAMAEAASATGAASEAPARPTCLGKTLHVGLPSAPSLWAPPPLPAPPPPPAPPPAAAAPTVAAAPPNAPDVAAAEAAGPAVVGPSAPGDPLDLGALPAAVHAELLGLARTYCELCQTLTATDIAYDGEYKQFNPRRVPAGARRRGAPRGCRPPPLTPVPAEEARLPFRIRPSLAALAPTTGAAPVKQPLIAKYERVLATPAYEL